MVVNEIIEVLKEGINPALSVVYVVVGGIISSVFLRKNTATKEFEKVKAGKFEEVIDDLLKSGEMTHSEFYKTKNFLSIARKADEYYSGNCNNSEFNNYDFDWFMRYYEAAGNVSDEDMQHFWAMILAGEIEHPESFSYKTIDVVRNISRQDAELFVEVCSHSMYSFAKQVLIPGDSDYLSNKGIKYSDIMYLSEIGLLFCEGTIRFDVVIDSRQQPILRNKNIVITVSDIEGKKSQLSLRTYPFTRAGIELSNIINKFASEEDLIEYGRIASKLYKKYHFELHRIIELSGNEITYKDENLLK